MTMFSSNSGAQAGSSRDRSVIGRSGEGVSVGRPGLISRDFLFVMIRRDPYPFPPHVTLQHA